MNKPLVQYLKANLPKKIVVLGVKFKVNLLYRIPKEDAADYTAAFMVGNDYTINFYVKRLVDMQQFKGLLIHELLHAALHVSGAEMLLSQEQEESIVIAFTNFMQDKIDFNLFNLEGYSGE